nr:protein unc-93 homolog A-like [Salvelinus alpinus]
MIDRNMKNILLVSIGFLSLFTAYGGLQSLQSSLNAEDGMGVTSLSVIYASIILSPMFLTPILIKNLGCKWTIVVGMGCYVTYSIGNLYPGWYTLIPTSVILGMGGSPLWSAKCTLLTICGNLQAPKENKAAADVINKYFGIFFLIFQSSAVWGNLMSSLIFGSDTDIPDISEEDLQYCGAGVCVDINVNSMTKRPAQELVWTLVGCYIGKNLLSVLQFRS